MAKNRQKRQKLFSLYSRNINLIVKRLGWELGFENEKGKFVKVQEPYICPICNQIFSSESLIQTDDNLNPLTLEDVPPKKLGGKPIILTCKNCNNEIGGKKLDSKLIWNLEMEPFFKGKPESHIKTYYEIDDKVTAKGKLTYLDKNKYQISFNPNPNPHLRKALANLQDKSTIKFRFQYPKSKLVNLALLRIAYLKMISLFGFGYFFNPSSLIISEQLHYPDKYIISDFGIPNINIQNFSETGIYYVNKPDNLKSFLVVFDVYLSGKKKTFSVFIPGPKKDNVNIYSDLRENVNYQIDIKPIPYYDFLNDSNALFGYNDIWNQLKSNK